jgi:phenylalanyl-tRNA synthetase alpha chain
VAGAAAPKGPGAVATPEAVDPSESNPTAASGLDAPSLRRAFRADLEAAADPAALEEVRRRHLGKASALKEAFKSLKDLAEAERPGVAAALNAARDAMEAELAARKSLLAETAERSRLESEWVDLSMPGVAPRRGSRHPVTEVERRCLEVLRQLGFELVEGPEVESEFYNFDALNIPPHHPARDLQDTFHVSGGLVLRSHTTPVQARVLEKRPPTPIRVASAGRVYRNEAVDATHLAMFHQLEGFWVEEGLGFAHLKGVLRFVVEALYGADRPFRFKPKYYPYTEPSLGMDVECISCGGKGCEACHGTGWVTIIGAGMIHRHLLTTFGYDPERVSGFAFGWGTTRMTTQWLGLARSKSLYEQDARLLRALHRGRP